MFRVLIALLFALASLAAQAKKPPPPPQFVVVRKLPPEAVTQRMQAHCLQEGMSVVSATPTQVTCTKPMDNSLRSAFVRALATPQYSTNPIYHFRVTAIRVGDNTTISAEEFVQYQSAFGQVTTIPIQNRKELTSIGTGLQNMKVTWEARLSAAGDDEVAALEASNAAQTSGTSATPPGVLGNGAGIAAQMRQAAATASTASLNPSAAAAKQTLAQYQCLDSFRMVGESGGKSLFEGTCRSGETQLVECKGMSCRALR
jgi:hypothetical protein